MDDLLGFFIFVIIAVFSIIGRFMKEKKESTESDETFSEVPPPIEISDATRRMVYGDDDWDIPVAKPKVSGRTIVVPETQRPPVTAQRPQPRPAVRTAQHPQQSLERPVQRPVSPQSPVQRPVQAREMPRPAAQGPRPTPQAAPRPSAPAGRTVTSYEQRAKPARAPRPAKASAQRPTQSRPQRSQQRMPQVQTATPGTAFVSDLHHALGSRDEIVRALVLREILGPPKALDEMMF